MAVDCESPNGLAAPLTPAQCPLCAATTAAVIVCRPMAGMLFPAFSIGFSPSYYNYSKRHARRRRNYSPRVVLVQASAAAAALVSLERLYKHRCPHLSCKEFVPTLRSCALRSAPCCAPPMPMNRLFSRKKQKNKTEITFRLIG